MGQDISTLVNSIRTGVSNNHLLKNIGMIHNRVIPSIILNNQLPLNSGMDNNNNSCNNSCLRYRHLFSHQECNQMYSPLPDWALMFKELGRVSPHKVHQCNMGRQQVDNNRQWVLNHHRKGNHHLIVNSTHSQVDTSDRDISEHFIHFTEGECSDT